MNWYFQAFKKYFDFKTRSRRKEYFIFMLLNIVLYFLLLVLGSLSGSEEVLGAVVALYLLYSLFAMIPGLALSVRRLHDTGKSGWWFLINFIPVIGPLVFLFFVVQDSMPGVNEWGVSPKA